MEIIVGRKGNQKTPITDPMVSKQHCMVTSLGDGKFKIKNLSKNGTLVNGFDIDEAVVTEDTIIQLGPNFSVRIKDLLPAVDETSGNNTNKEGENQPEVPSYSIKPLQSVWDKYHDTLLDIQNSQRSLGLFRSASPLFTLGSGTISMFSRSLGLGEYVMYVTGGLTIIGFTIMVYCFYKAYNDDSVAQKEKATKDFQDNYICPNPKCHRFMGNQPYNILRQNNNCPYCKCKFTEQ